MFVELSHFRSSLTTSSVLEIFPDESLVHSTNTFDSLLDFSTQPPDIFDDSPRQVEDEQVDDELPHLEAGSPTPALPKDPSQDIPSRHSTWVRSILHIYLTIIVTLHLLHFTSLKPIMRPPLTLYGRLQ